MYSANKAVTSLGYFQCDQVSPSMPNNALGKFINNASFLSPVLESQLQWLWGGARHSSYFVYWGKYYTFNKHLWNACYVSSCFSIENIGMNKIEELSQASMIQCGPVV